MTSVFCTSTRTPTAGSTRESASTASTEWKKVAPAPPKRSGISMPMTPRSNSRVSRPGSSTACSSISRTRGRISWEAKSKTESWKSRSSSDSVERADGTSGLRAHGRNAIIAKKDGWHAEIAARAPRTMAPARWPSPLCLAACRRRLAAAAQQGQRPAAGAAGAAGRRRRAQPQPPARRQRTSPSRPSSPARTRSRSSAAASTSSAST